jgi:hypothetical protein
MLAEQTESDELDAGRARIELRAPAARAQADLTGWIDRATPKAPAARADEIRIDQSHRIPFANGPRERAGVRGKLVVAGLAASLGLASLGMFVGYFAFKHDVVSSTAPVRPSDLSGGTTNLPKGDRLPIHRTVAREPDRAMPAKPPHGPKPTSSTPIARSKPSRAADPPPSADYHPANAQPPGPSTTPGAAEAATKTPLVPVPETRPTTINGWVVREVVDGTAVLEGPGGIWRARRGDTVPGVGKIVGILRWGNRLLVATSSGLISTH